jgi:toxin ParE1/3/4
MNVVWSIQAIEDLSFLRAYIAEDSPAGARRIATRILQTVENLLSDNPNIGRPGRVPGTRELVIPRTPYIIPYRVHDGNIQILRVYHSSRRWPESL